MACPEYKLATIEKQRSDFVSPIHEIFKIQLAYSKYFDVFCI